jgi:5-methylcytosine-specific restriction endonuclease McrA
MSYLTKRCTKCARDLPATAEFFNHSTRNKDGLYSSCRDCREQFRRVNAEKIKAQKADEYQRHKEKYVAYSKAKGLENWRRYYQRKRDELIQKVLGRQRKDRKKTLQRRRELYQSHPEKDRARTNEWRRKNPDKNMEQYQRRRAIEMNSVGSHTAKDVRDILEGQQYLCYWCGCDIGKSFQVDHFIPLSRNGTDYPDNLVGSCGPCNASKKDRIPYLEWIPPRLRQT